MWLNKKEQDLEKPETNARFQSFLNSFLAMYSSLQLHL